MANEFLDVPGSMGDGTAASQDGGPNQLCSAAARKRGWTLHPVERTSPFDRDETGENEVGDPYEYGGFLGRPRGNAR